MDDLVYSDSIITICIITFLSCVFYLLGLNLFKHLYIPKKYFFVEFSHFAIGIFLLYFFCIITLFATASEIPLLSALQGTDSAELVIARSLFIKERQGWESILIYLITILDTTILPFIIVESIRRKFKYRYIFILVFFLYSISFLEKAYFFKLLMPIGTYFYLMSKNKKVLLIKVGLLVIGLLLFMYSITGISSKVENTIPGGNFFSQNYQPSSAIGAIVWRALSVPIFTALDALNVFRSSLDGEYLFGSTSSILSAIFGMERSNFERIVYQYQFGGIETGNSNQFYGIEAFVNFGYWGVILFSFFIGRVIQVTLKSEIICYICVLPTFIYNLFNAGLIGIMLSNGYIVFFLLFVGYIRFK